MAAVSRAEFHAAAVATGDLAVLETYFSQDHVIAEVARANAYFQGRAPSINIFDESPPDPWYFMPMAQETWQVHGDDSGYRDFIFTKALAVGLTDVIGWFYAPPRVPFLGQTLSALLPFTGALAVDEDQVGVVETLLTSQAYEVLLNDAQKQQFLNDLLCVAIERSHDHMIELLVAHGACVNPTDDDGRDNPLAACAGMGDEESIAALIDNGAFVVGANVLVHSSYLGNVEAACELLRSGVDWGNHSGRCNPLHAAAEDGHADLVRIYLEEGFADVDAPNARGETPLMMATWQATNDRGAAVGPHAAEAVTRVLLECGADASLKDAKGSTALHHAVGTEYTSVVALLLVAGIDPNERNNRGNCPIDLIPLSRLGDPDGSEFVRQAELLVGFGTDVYASGPDGTSALDRLEMTTVGLALLSRLGIKQFLVNGNDDTGSLGMS